MNWTTELPTEEGLYLTEHEGRIRACEVRWYDWQINVGVTENILVAWLTGEEYPFLIDGNTHFTRWAKIEDSLAPTVTLRKEADAKEEAGNLSEASLLRSIAKNLQVTPDDPRVVRIAKAAVRSVVDATADEKKVSAYYKALREADSPLSYRECAVKAHCRFIAEVLNGQ